MYQLILALNYLHQQGIIHHDIKPSNILLSKPLQESGGEDLEVKLCDFGASRVMELKPSGMTSPFRGIYGTSGYLAPELLQQQRMYNCSIDIWSTGIVLFEIIYSYAPFYPPSACCMTSVEFPPNSRFFQSSEEVQDLISKMLQPDPALRLTASEVLAHAWFSSALEG